MSRAPAIAELSPMSSLRRSMSTMASPVSKSRPLEVLRRALRRARAAVAVAGQPLASHWLIRVAPGSTARTILAILPIIQAKRQPRPDGTVLALSLPVALEIERDGRERRTTGRSSPQEAAT